MVERMMEEHVTEGQYGHLGRGGDGKEVSFKL